MVPPKVTHRWQMESLDKGLVFLVPLFNYLLDGLFNGLWFLKEDVQMKLNDT